MRELVFMPLAWKQLAWWLENDIKMVKKIYKILDNILRTPFDGLGQPEPLKLNYSGYWSRRINQEHRIVYKVEDEQIIVHSILGHYQN
ncbi:MAG: Txe/YoeB family addiction module toxin [Candidatus Kapaibacterium sp.]|nr:Txe/YoeB family addiction module toxin [Bacteroidota bacterium]